MMDVLGLEDQLSMWEATLDLSESQKPVGPCRKVQRHELFG
jgi:hypothetical protein